MLQLSIIVPTYCEAENLTVLIPRVNRVLTEAELDAEIIVVDDDSPDETIQVCEKLAENCPLRLITRKNERGLSTAVIAGLNAASGGILLVMDADLSHPPEKIPELVSALNQRQADFVIGSRYVEGGTTDQSWGWFRKWNSRVATWLSRPFTSARDPLAGFFAIKRQTYLKAHQILNPVGYKIGLELIVKCRCRNVVEIPIEFTDRVAGSSKLSFKEQLRYLKHLKRLFDFKYQNYAYFTQFALIGLTGVFVNLQMLALLSNWMISPIAVALAIWTSMSTNFLLNRNITFSYARHKPFLKQYLSYCGSCLTGAVFNWLTTMVLSRSFQFFEKRILLAAFIGILVGMGFNFLLCRYLVFSKHKPEAETDTAATDKELRRTE
ncbi:glycosyltransferase [Gimesia maris]|uniref:Undecaprenyl-phosphate mannosyltransferase n=1 Tax=Gimesia maris TaxID=122 RepID=A0ABX5YT05_9PLAN|nr:glycosyltransferase family 2 protein [Gimesia maris]EDL60234.1 glycosyltransferase involved in cell wall biogenesis [Gimesia maris DSM 8797]QDU16613.1 Undecaprenyl-phosphate mannosyltransferase [Gimesia maris]QEG18653.1 Undecaprenyl-phosphate mannosyltransferase [Gimesia maris]QGQ28401.1 glycosyltransferase family 2 protein [Gimesia maris]